MERELTLDELKERAASRDFQPDLLDKKPNFTVMDDSTAEDWAIFAAHRHTCTSKIADRALQMMRELGDEKAYGGLPVSHLEHGLQCATRALNAGYDEEYVVCCLLHDIGFLIAPHNHAEATASFLKPYISKKHYWMMKYHTVFEGYHFWHIMGGDRHARDAWRWHPHFNDLAEFIEMDQRAFDPDYKTLPLEAFEEMVQRVLAQPREDFHEHPRETLRMKVAYKLCQVGRKAGDIARKMASKFPGAGAAGTAAQVIIICGAMA